MAYMITAKEGQLTENIFKITVGNVSAHMLTKNKKFYFKKKTRKVSIIILFYFAGS